MLRGGSPQCDTIAVEADVLDCTTASCDLKGHARMACTGFVLFADTIHVEFDEEQRFTGAVATGDVTAVEGDTILTCNSATLSGDRIRGRIEGARVEVKKRALPAQRLEAEKNRAEIRGDLNRTGDRTFSVDDSEFTLCDCGDDDPSWIFRSTSVDVDLDSRANLYWSTLWIAPFGVFEMPISPPIPYLSIPFSRRTMGFLAPGITLYDGLAPQIDLPFFIPIGRSWDLTLTPGLRTDWRSDEGNGLDAVGAPRLGARLRYAPTLGTSGELSLQFQRDVGGEAARTGLDDDDPDPCEDPDNVRCNLKHRLAIQWEHRSEITDTIDFTARGSWYTDDRLLADAALSVTERVNTYTVSRAQLDWRLPTVYAAASVDYLLRLTGQDGELDNTRGAEISTLHRGPHFELRLPAFHLGHGFHVEALGTATRYGAWLTRLFADEAGLPPSQWVLRSYAGGAWLGGIGPVSLRARAGLDGVLSVPSTLGNRALNEGLEPIDTEERQVLSLLAEGFAELPLVRRYGSTKHLLIPKLGIRSIPWQSGDPTAAARFDPFLQRSELTQAVIGVDQEWLNEKGQAWVRLSLEQPFDLKEGERLQSAIRAELNPLRGLQLRGWTQIATDADDPIREAGASISARYKGITSSAAYAWIYEDTERLRRTVFQIAGTPASTAVDPDDPGSEQYLRGRIGLDLAPFTLSYGIQALLPRPGGSDIADQVLTVEERPIIPSQDASIGYRSPCECWGFAINVVRALERVQVDGETMVEPTYNLNFQFQIGDYALGSR